MPINEDHLRSARLRRGPILLCLAAAIIAVWVGVALFVHWRDLPPHVVIPSPKVPAHNAYDDFQRAYKLERDSGEVAFALPSKHSHITPDDHPYTAAQRAAIILDNSGALKAVQEGLRHPYVVPGDSLDPIIPSFGGDREMGRLLFLASYVDAERGDFSDAAGIDLDCIQMGAKLTHSGGIMSTLVAFAIEDMGDVELEKDLTHLSSSGARAAAHRLGSIALNTAPLSQIVRDEEWIGEAELLREMRGGNWRAFSRDDDETLAHSVMKFLSNQRWSEKQIFNHYTGYMRRMELISRRPYPLRKALPPIPSDPFNSDTTPVLQACAFVYARMITFNRILIVDLALHAYELDHHRFPDRLSALAQVYLPTIPIDPFTVNSPLLYHRTNTRYVLYSVGPDGKDDNGRPAPNIGETSKGDIGTMGTRYGVKAFGM